MQFIAEQPWAMYIFLCLTLGLAPYNPPHLWEKLVMLKNGTLKRPVDWFDLVMHATPWVLLFLKWTTTWAVQKQDAVSCLLSPVS